MQAAHRAVSGSSLLGGAFCIDIIMKENRTMKKNQILALLLAAVMLLAVLTGCAAKTEPTRPY